MRTARGLARGLAVLAPFGVLYLLPRYGHHAAVAFTVLVVALNWPTAWFQGGRRAPAAAAILVGGFLVVAFLVPQRAVVLLYPVAVNLALMTLFLITLLRPPSIVESIARQMSGRLLDDVDVRYCRNVTRVWVAFFLLDAGLVAYFAAFRTVAEWAVLTGVVNYVLIGALFAAEYTYRKWRFGDFDNRFPPDRLLRALLKR